MLKAEKRHRKSCRFDQYDRARTKCPCSYHAIGVLNGTFLRRSLKTSNYETAIRTIRKWESLGAARESQSIAIEDAVGAFMRDIGARNWQEATKRKFRTLLQDRLVGYGQHGYRLLRELDLNAVTEFRAIWKDAPLTALKNIERLRAFYRFCLDREWVTGNPAAKLKVKIAVEEKEPFTPEEFERTMAATEQYRDGRSRKDLRKAAESRAFVLVLRHSGLRISDAVKLERTQLVPGTDSDGYALMVQQQKVRRTVYIPLPDGRDGLPDAVGALKARREVLFLEWQG